MLDNCYACLIYSPFVILTREGRWIVLKVNRKLGKVLVEHQSDGSVSDSEKAFDEMLEHLTPENNRYVVVKLTYTTRDGRATENIAMFMWRGSKSKSKAKMVYAGTCQTVRNCFTAKTFHEYDSKADLTHADLVSRCDK